jgi:nucleoid DNA-binding protein
MDQFNKPDFTKPRYRAKRLEIDGIDFYKALIAKVPEAAKLSHAETRDLVKQFNETVLQNIVDNREGVELPQGLGYIFIGSCKIKKECVDYGKSIKYGIRVTHKNWNTEGYASKIFYSNCSVKYRVQDNNLWMFKAARNLKKHASKAFSENWNKYIHIDESTKLSKYISIGKNIEKLKKKNEDILKTYNEFE